jgi:hypothetical protein
MSESNIQGSPGSIFICYRREDSADVTGRIYDRLVSHFGPEHVFMDVEAIRLGYDFRSEIDQRIKVCSIVIVVIGDKWLAQVDGKRRIDNENDRVRIEIEAALRREIPIIPVLARGASHPTKAMLPASLEALAYRHGTSIRHEHFRGDVDSLISKMDKLLARQETTPGSEESIYSDTIVLVTTARVIISGTTYALRNITSAKMTVTPATEGCAMALLVVGILGVLFSFGAFAEAWTGFAWLVISGGIVAVGIFWVRSLKPSYNVIIASSAGEIRALDSKDKDYVSKIVDAINEALVRYR